MRHTPGVPTCYIILFAKPSLIANFIISEVVLSFSFDNILVLYVLMVLGLSDNSFAILLSVKPDARSEITSSSRTDNLA